MTEATATNVSPALEMFLAIPAEALVCQACCDLFEVPGRRQVRSAFINTAAHARATSIEAA